MWNGRYQLGTECDNTSFVKINSVGYKPGLTHVETGRYQIRTVITPLLYKQMVLAGKTAYSSCGNWSISA